LTAPAAGRFNPFPGLRPFEADETHLFFGREVQIDDLLGRLRKQHFVAVVGTSGSGKSSLVRAGMLPALHGGYMVGAGAHWRIGMMRPGTTPIRELAKALDHGGILGEEGDSELRVDLAQAVLNRGALGLVEILRQARLRSDENVLILIDQFEELFTYRKARPGSDFSDESTAFVKLLLAAAAETDLRTYVVITMRSDFLGDSAEFRDLPEAINDSLFLVPRMRRQQLQAAIEGPIAVAGAKIAPRLTARLLNDPLLGDDPDQLPVLQHALMRTYDIWEADHAAGEPIDVRHYEATGGLAEALSRHADDVYDSLRDEGSRRIAERLFKALTDRSGDNRGIRRPTMFADALAITEAPDEDALRAVIEPFRAPECSFLTPAAGKPLESGTVLDISHESLMRIWKRMRSWLDQETQSAQIYRRLHDSALLHARGEAALLRNPDLPIAIRWRDEQQPNAAWAERYGGRFDETMRFLDASETERVREARARTRSVRLTIVGLAATVLILLLLSGTTYRQWVIAQDQLKVAAAERLARIDRNMYEEDQNHTDRVKALLAADAFSIAPAAEADEVLLAGVIRLSGAVASTRKTTPLPLLGRQIASFWIGNFASQGSRLIVPLGATAMRVVQLDRYRIEAKSPETADDTVRLRDAADGVHAVSLNVATGEARIWDISGAAPRTINAFPIGNVDGSGSDYADAQIAYDPASGRLSIGTKSGIVRFASDGHRLESRSWDQYATAAGLPRPYPSGPDAHVLSARGNYILFNYPKNDWVITIGGRRVGSALDLKALSPDERFAFGRDSESEPELAAYSLPDWHATQTHIPKDSALVAGSHDGKTFAYPDDQDGAKIIRLYDFASNTEYFKGLPAPPGFKRYQALAFSADDRYVIVNYDDTSGGRWLAVYTIDPEGWLRTICRLGRPPLSAAEFAKVAPAEHYVDGCAPFERATPAPA
jgi:hypothetical protein